MTRQIVEAAFEVLAKFDAIEALKLVLEVEIPNMILILNTIDQGSLTVGGAYSLRLNNPQFRMDRLLRKAVELW